MTAFIQSQPGESVYLVVQTDEDLKNAPAIESLYQPNLDKAEGFPKKMTELEPGLWVFTINIPDRGDLFGTFIAVASWNDDKKKSEIFHIHVTKQIMKSTTITAS